MSEPSPLSCPHCLSSLPPHSLGCPTCHRLVFEARVGALIQESQRIEAKDPAYAAGLLRQALAFVPEGSQPYGVLAGRAATLAARAFGGPASAGGPVLNHAPPESRTGDNWMTALLKTGGSMALSMWVYQRSSGWFFAIGFVLLILIHELGHSIANWYFGIKQSPPIFIPYVGALIWLKSNPRDAKTEAVIGIAGPVAGTLGALVCYGVSFAVHNVLWRLQLQSIAQIAFFMNLFNMIPCPPLDGGRVTAAITPWLWIPGVAAFGWVMYRFSGGGSGWTSILVGLWILQSALPRIKNALRAGGQRNPYYRTTLGERALVAASYVLLSGLLIGMIFGPGLLHSLPF